MQGNEIVTTILNQRGNLQRTNAILCRIIAAQLLLFAVTIAGFAWLGRPMVAPPVIVATTDGRVIKLPDTSQPIANKSQVLDWASKAILQLYDFTWINYRDRLQNASQYWSNKTWNEFWQSAWDKTGNFKVAVEGRYIVNGIVTRSPIVTKEGPQENGIYSWLIELPLSISYQTANISRTQNVIAEIVVHRVPVTVRPDGLLIVRYRERIE
jgi:intracellular multiplication protein IcmL